MTTSTVEFSFAHQPRIDDSSTEIPDGAMCTRNVRSWKGAFGVVCCLLILIEFPLYVLRSPAPLLTHIE